ncbi:FG-GAP repeat domain-containing protein [Poriferisphaera sp. WC338]|uniref:FG-GAP repeat domain-containing protein n=1 Tax=Poriferisphaera sp. WC338 TaxID=3425129 RepID=UPI003D818F48
MQRSMCFKVVFLIGIFIQLSTIGHAAYTVFDHQGTQNSFYVRRGEVIRWPNDKPSEPLTLYRKHQPEQGTWDNIQIDQPQPRSLNGNMMLSMMINAVPHNKEELSRIRRIELTIEGVGSRVFESDMAMYRINNKRVSEKKWIDLDRSKRSWQRLTLDLSDVLQPNDRVKRITIQFTNKLDLYVREVQFMGGAKSSAQDAKTLARFGRLETRSNQSDFPWVIDSSYRIIYRCETLPGGISKPLAWAEIDLIGMKLKGLLPGLGGDPLSVCVVAYDPKTQKPIKQRDEVESSTYLVASKAEQWARLPMPYHRNQVRRPLQVSWLRDDQGKTQPIYAIYFDLIGSKSPSKPQTPAALGTGDALAFGQSAGPIATRGVPMPLDYNQDGLMDLMTVCGTVPDRGVYLMLNKGTAEQELMSAPIYLGSASIKGTPQVADVDGDGTLDIAHEGGFYRNVIEAGFTNHVRIADPPEFDIWRTIPPSRGGRGSWSFTDWDGDGVRDVLIGTNEWTDYGWTMAYNKEGKWTRGPLKGQFYFFRNRGSHQDYVLEYPERLMIDGETPANVYGYASPVAVDIDRDGDLDLLTGDFLDRLMIFENIGDRRHPKLAAPIDVQTTQGAFRADRQVVTPVVTDWDGDGDIDILLRCEGAWATLLENSSGEGTGMPVFLPERVIRCENDRLNVGELPVVDMHDWDGDGDEDLIFGNSSGELGWFENTSQGKHLSFDNAVLLQIDGKPFRLLPGESGSLQGPAEALWGYTVPDVADWDHDGTPDIMYNSVLGEIDWIEKKAGSHQEVQPAKPVMVAWDGPTPKPAWRWWDPKPGHWLTQWRCNVRMIDWNHDELLDVVTLDTEGYLVLHKRFMEKGQLKLGPAQRIFMNESNRPFRANHVRPGNSGRIKFDFADWDQDGDLDYMQVVPASWHRGNAVWYENIGTNQSPILAKRNDLGDVVLTGHTSSPRWIDLDRNGTLDVLIAAEDGHFYFFSGEYIKYKDQMQAKPVLN